MSLNCWRFLFIVAALQSLIISFAKANQAGSCFSSSFTRAIGYILRGFVLGETRVTTMIECKRRCVVSANCLSLNILTNADGSFLCQLNSGLKENGARAQFVPHGAGEYCGLKKKKLCADSGKTCDLSASPIWHAFNQSYFKIVTSPELNFDDALKFCRAGRGDLASFSSEEEQTFLFKTFVKGNTDVNLHAWVGLNDMAEEGVFVWTDESPVTHARYAPSQPDNYDGGENCVSMSVDVVSDGSVGDLPCSYQRAFICETSYNSL